MPLKDYYNTGDDGGTESYAPDHKYGQTFTTTSAYDIDSVKLKGYRLGSPGTITLELYATSGGTPTGGVLATGTYNGNLLGTDTSGTWFEIPLSSAYSLSDSTKYAIIAYSSIDDINNSFVWRQDASSPTYANGTQLELDEGVWFLAPWADFMFETYSEFVFLPPTDIATNRRLCACANNQFWYEDI